MNNLTTNFGIETENFFKHLPYDEKKEFLHFNQFIVNKFFLEKDRRGILIYHSMGFGKTMLAVSIVEAYRQLDPTRKSIILLPKSLQNNFEETVRSYIRTTDNGGEQLADESIDAIIEEQYKFISSNSSNMYDQIGKIDKTAEEIEFEKNIGILTEKVNSESLENSVLVIDEFHNLANAITNGSKNGLKLYNKIMNTRDIKLIFLTGTPIINYPFELVCTMNMLSGTTLFPENIRDFITFFIDRNQYTIKNKSKFQNRITGLVSYYGDEYFEGKKPGFPTELPMKIEKVPMSKEQFARYLEMREIEKKEESRRFKSASGEDAQFNEKGGKASSSYRIRSRQVSNFLIPGVALTQRGAKSDLKDVAKIPPETYRNLKTFSPKYQRILDNVNKHSGQLQLVFSQFTSAEGLTIFGKVLEAHGFDLFSAATDESVVMRQPRPPKGPNVKKVKKQGGVLIMSDEFNDDDSEDDGLGTHDSDSGGESEFVGGGAKRYAIYSGDILPSVRDSIIKTFNSPENRHGELIAILLVSHQTGGLGLDLHGVRAIHIMEPYWNWSLIMQIIGRGVRYHSHDGFPAAEQNVQPYMYISDFPTSYIAPDDSDESKYTTDMHLYVGARKARKLNESFLMALVEASVDCSIHHKKLSKDLQKKINCHLCAPTDQILYEANFYKDMSAPDPCQQFIVKKIQTQEILFTPPESDKPMQFYYNADDIKNIKLFEYNDTLEGYVQIKPSHPYFSDLMRVILKI